MNLKRMTLLGAVVAFVAVVGAGAFNAQPAAALTPSSKICTPSGGGTFPFNPVAFPTTLACELTLNSGTPLGIIPPGTVIQVTLFGGAATFTNVSYIGSCAGNVQVSTLAPTVFVGPGFTFPAGANAGAALGPTQFSLANSTYFVSVGGLIGCLDGTIRISEVITVPAAVAGGTIIQAVTPLAAFNPGGLAAANIVATGPGGVPLVLGVAPPVFGGVTPGGPFVVTITSNGCSVGTTFVVGTTVNTVAPGQTATCRFDLDDNEPGFLSASAGVPATTCVANTATFPTAVLAGGATALPASECVSSGLISAIFPATLAGIFFGNAGAGTTINVRCPAGNVSATNSCDFIDITFTTTTAAVVASVATVNLTYDPDVDAQNTTAGPVTFNVFTIVIAPINPNAFTPRVTCTTAASATIPGFTLGNALFGFGTGFNFPGQIGANQLLAVSVLPVPVNCTVTFFAGTGTTATQIAIPAGSFEVTSLQGALIDATGRLSTNLRIGCGGAPTGDLIPVTGAVIVDAVNSCVGITFSVAGTGVGLTEVRVRYEPRNATIAGITVQTFEIAFAVAFVAPQAVLDLTLAPNPVSAGGTSTVGTATSDGVATLTLNPTFGANVFRDPITNTPFLDPVTGLPLLLNTGSILNGSVIFTIDNTAIARFVGSGLSTLGTTTTPGVTNTVSAVASTSDTVIVRCGTLAQSLAVGVAGTVQASVSGLAPFFGGCRTASVGYRGIVAGSANITATFVPDLPGAVNSGNLAGLGLTTAAFTGFSSLNFGGFSPSSITRQLQVLDAPVVGNINLVRGCNNVSPTVTESVSAFIARAQNTTVISVFEYQAATNTFLGAPGPGAPAGAPGDLAGVTRLRPVFICVTGPGTLNQPAA